MAARVVSLESSAKEFRVGTGRLCYEEVEERNHLRKVVRNDRALEMDFSPCGITALYLLTLGKRGPESSVKSI
jgi:hypothetical protein